MLTPLVTKIPILLLLSLLLIATWIDFKQHRVPNILTFGGMAAGLGIQIWTGGGAGLLTGLGGLAVGMAMLLPLYVVGGMGAGDVKLMAAVGTFLGPMNTLLGTCSTLMVGGLIAVGLLMIRRGMMAFLRRYWRMLQCLLTTGAVFYEPPRPGEAAAGRFPYAIAITAGTVVTLLWLAQ